MLLELRSKIYLIRNLEENIQPINRRFLHTLLQSQILSLKKCICNYFDEWNGEKNEGRRRRKRTSKSNHDAAKKLLICVAKYGSKSRDS